MKNLAKIKLLILALIILGGVFVFAAKNIYAEEDAGGTSQSVDVVGAPAASGEGVDTAGGEAPKEGATVVGLDGQTQVKQEEESFLMPYILGAILFVINLAMTFLNWCVALAAGLAEFVLTITSFTKVEVVTVGWGITRGLANMGFALVLLLMAFATVLQIESYGARRLLGRLVLAALLINFSLVFAGVIIDFAQVLTDFFINAAAGSKGLTANLMNGFGVAKVYSISKDASYFQNVRAMAGQSSSTVIILNGIMGCIILAIAAFTFLAFAFMLIFRIVWIWLLLIFAPLAWVSMVIPGLPGLGSGWSKWWSKFFQWVFFAPVYAFFLYLALLIAQNGIDLNGTNSAAANFSNTFAADFFQKPLIILQYIVMVVILLGGLQFAQSTGITGANTMMDLGRNLRGMGGRWAARGGQLIPGGDWLSRKMGPQKWAQSDNRSVRAIGKAMQGATAAKKRLVSFTNPDVWTKAWAASKQRSEMRSFSQASGALQDLLGRKGKIKTLLGGQQGYYQNIERNKALAERQAEITKALPDEDMRAQEFLKSKDPVEKEAILRSLGSTNSVNTLAQNLGKQELQSKGLFNKSQALDQVNAQIDKIQTQLGNNEISQETFNQQYKSLNDQKGQLNISPAEEEEIDKIKSTFSLAPESFQRMMQQQFGNDSARIGNDIVGMMVANGNFSVAGTYRWNPDTNQPEEVTDLKAREDIAGAKMREMEPQDFWRKMHPDSLFEKKMVVTEDGKIDYKVSGLNTNGKVILKNLTNLHYNQSNRAQARTLSQLLNKENQEAIMKSFAGDKEMENKFTEAINAIASANKMTIYGEQITEKPKPEPKPRAGFI